MKDYFVGLVINFDKLNLCVYTLSVHAQEFILCILLQQGKQEGL